MKYFDFTNQILAAYAAATNDVERYSVRTRVGKEQFPIALEKAGVLQIHKQDPSALKSNPHVLVVGISTWNDEELESLEELVAICHDRDVLLLVFDLDECQSMEDINKFIPEAEFVRATPVIAQYRNGQRVTFEQGIDAIRWLRQF